MDERINQRNPFPGIRCFESDEDYLFFGRESQIKLVIEKLTKARFLAITGSSGSGKSSFVKAGIVPSLFKDKLFISQNKWNLSIFRPGSSPLQNFASALFQSFANEDSIAEELNSEEKVLAKLKNNDEGFTEIIEVQNKISNRNRLLIIDQFEELFRFKLLGSSSKNESAEFVKKILSVLSRPSLSTYIVLTMRSDFLGECSEYAGLPDAINTGNYLLPRMTDDEKRSAIEGPIKASGAQVTERLIQRLLHDVGDDPYQLPVMQHALMRTWNHWMMSGKPDTPVDLKNYEEIGTMSDAISRHAEQVYADLPTDRSRFITEKLFKSLIFLGSEYDNRGTRRPTRLSEIVSLTEAKPDELIDVIDRFRAPGCAYLTPNYKVSLDMDSIIDISHESIMRKWKRLKEWVDNEMKSAERYLRLSKSAELYFEGKAGLLINPELQITLRWQQQNRPNEAWAKRYDPSFERAMTFLNYSKKEYDLEITKKENQQKRDLKRAKRFAIILGGASVISLLFLVISLNLTFKSEESERVAVEKGSIALFESQKAEQQRNEAIAQKKISEQQQQIAEQQKIITEEQKQYALEQQKIALEQKQVAVTQKQQADIAKVEAIKARDEAERQRKDAVTQKQIAETERVKAEKSEKNTMRLRLLDIARSVSIQSVRMQNTDKDDLPRLLALQAYIYNAKNNGAEFSPDIFHALSSFAQDTKVLRGHQDDVRGIAISPDGKTIASCSDDGSVKLWNTNNSDKGVITLHVKNAGKKGFRCIAYSPDGKSIAAGTFEGSIVLWNADAIKSAPKILNGHTYIVNDLAFSKDGRTLVSCSSDGTLRSWDLTRQLINSNIIEKSGSKINCIAFDPYGGKLARGSEDGSIKIYSFFALSVMPEDLSNGGRAVRSVAFSSDSKILAAGYTDGLIKLYSPSHPELKPVELIGHNSSVNSISFSNNGKLLASASSDKSIRLWSYKNTDQLPVVINDHDSWIYSVKFSPDGNKIISASADKTIRTNGIKTKYLAEKIRNKTGRNMTHDEWNKYVGGDIAYQKTLTCLP